MQLHDIDIDESELRDVVDSALARVTPDYAAARFESSSVLSTRTPSRSSLSVILLHIRTRSISSARGQYAPLTSSHNRGFVDEYLVGVIHGHWQAAHGRDLFREFLFVVDVLDTEDAPPLYSFVDIADAYTRGLIADTSPIATASRRYCVRRLLRVGDHLAGPSPGLIKFVASETERLGEPCFLDLFAGSCVLARVALEHGARRAVCIDTMMDEEVAAENLGRFAPRVELRQATLRSGLGSESYDLVAVDPFYDHTLIALEEFAHHLDGRFQCAVVNLGLALPTTWQARVQEALEHHTRITRLCEIYGERIAICEAKQ
jgi:hypothetical protein